MNNLYEDKLLLEMMILRQEVLQVTILMFLGIISLLMVSLLVFKKLLVVMNGKLQCKGNMMRLLKMELGGWWILLMESNPLVESGFIKSNIKMMVHLTSIGRHL